MHRLITSGSSSTTRLRSKGSEQEAENGGSGDGGRGWFRPVIWAAFVAETLHGEPDLSPAVNEILTEGTGLDDPEGKGFIAFAGGCFWCLQRALDEVEVEGVVNTECGYMGGLLRNPTYGKVQSRKSGHVEVVRVTFDKSLTEEELQEATKISMRSFLDAIDPTDDRGQEANRGPQYRPAIFFSTASQERAALDALEKESLRRGNRKLAVRLRRATTFWVAEEFHQDYYKKNGLDPNVETPYWMGAFLD
ncbi:peptide methionine sulfoxide reductase MsrA [Chloropicon primus]|nr:peptide methionine sulfoxide reductase MsrA [Chloropicon primus]